VSRGHAVSGEFDEPTRSVMPDEGVAHVHLLRHGMVEGFGARTVRGHLDAALSPEGHAQHEALVRWYAGNLERPDRILSSDLSRCTDLAQRLATRLDVSLEVTPTLREQHMGDWEGCTWEELTTRYGHAVNDYWDDYLNARPPGGESLADTALRLREVWRELTATHDGRRLLVVTHAGVIRLLLCEALGVPPSEALRFAPPAASHTQLQLARAGAVLSSLGERPWLGAGAGAGADAGAAVGAGLRRIALSGSAGTGKTTLGRRLAKELGLPFVEEGMRKRLEGGLDLHTLDHDDMRALLLELWEEQCAAEDAAPDGFVSDRSAADFAAFWIFYGFHHEEGATDRFFERALERLQRTERVVLFPWGALPLRSDGVRSTNRWVQFMFQSLVEGVLERHAGPRLARLPLECTDLERRLAFVRRSVGQTA
jgi:alpha-ribazole phosphatase